MATADHLIDAARSLSDRLDPMAFAAPVTHVGNPLTYAWPMHEAYLRRFADGPRRVVFLGMNPGPWGMAQTGVPFGEVAAVRDWLQLDAPVSAPQDQHPKRPVQGLACSRSEVSGRRLWGLFADRFGTPDRFFRGNFRGGVPVAGGHFVANYCPLVFMEASGRNRTPDKLPIAEREPLEAACDAHLARLVKVLEPRWLVGVGKFAEARAQRVLDAAGNTATRTGCILHPSPASPAANRDWAGTATRQLVDLGVWEP